MNKTTPPTPAPAIREMVMMGINRIVVAPSAATFKTPGVYIEEIPSG